MTRLLSDSTCSESSKCCGRERDATTTPAPGPYLNLDLLRVHFLEGEIHSTGGDGGCREEVIRSVREEIDPWFQLVGLHLRQRHRDRLRHRLTHEQAERGAHRDRDQSRCLPDGVALELVPHLVHLLAEPVLGLARHRRHRHAGVEEGTYDTIGPALTPDPSEVWISRQ